MVKVKITIPNNNLKEREYIIDIIFNEYLGLEYKLDIGTEDYEVILTNGKTLTIKDTFFNSYPNNLEYLKLENIPKKIEALDIFAASFFMLTRWEEYVNKSRDDHKRFPAMESLAFRQGFLNRPIVNEYIEELKQKLLELDGNIQFKEQKFELVLTHDVDNLYMWRGWKQVFRVALGDVLNRQNFTLAYSRVREYYLIKQNKIKDPFDTFDWLMDKSEAIGVKSRFYFMSGGVTEYDNRYKIDEPKSLALIEKIKKRGHIIGIHPSYNAYNDGVQFKKELDVIEKTTGLKITEGREHYLRFEVPTTWQIWEDNGIKVDSTCGYADKEGFRCGTGDAFSVFNILTREKLQLKERPLIVMDDSLYMAVHNNTKKSIQSRLKKVLNYTENTSLTILWHNSSIGTLDIYGDIIMQSRINTT